MSDSDHWDVSPFQTSAIIQQLKPLTDLFAHFSDWPTLENYKHIFRQYNLDIIPVAQSQNVSCFEEQYEPRVYLKKELQTRTRNWHDFFNALIWLSFPETKTALNNLHFKQAKDRKPGSNRTTLENRITQFDECGAIIITNNENLLSLIKNHQWEALFINQRDQLEKSLRCIVFGHAIFEKALNPYIGMTCHCILLNDENLLQEAIAGSFKSLDTRIANIWQTELSTAPGRFDALPILGMPGYWKCQNKDFYANKQYFR